MATLSVGGTTVFDGLALQSGVTVADMSNFTFPSGHILQCKGDRYDFKTEGSAINVTNSTTTPFGVGLEVAITCASTSNFLRLDTCLPDIYTAACSGGFHAGFVYDTSSFASSFTGLPGTAGSHANGQYVAVPYNLYGGTSGASIYPFSMMVYCPVPTTSAIKIRVYLRSDAAETYQIGGNFAAYSCHGSITVMEVQA